MDVCSLPVVAQICAGSGDVAAGAAASPIQGLADMVGGMATWVLKGMWALMVTTTMIDVTSAHYRRVYALVFGIAVAVMLIFFLLQVITGMTRRDPGALGRGVLGLGKSVLGSFLVVTLTAALLEVTDQLCLGLVQAAGTTMEQVGHRLIVMVTGIAISTTVIGVGPLLALFLAGMAFSAAFSVWIALLVRSALVLVAIALGPLALAGATWDATRGWVTKWATFVVALILSKLVMVVIFLVATEQMSAPIEADIASVAEPLTGIVLLMVGAFAPYLTYKFINFIGLDLWATMTTESDAKESLNRPMPYLPGGWPRPNLPKVVDSDGTQDSTNDSGDGASSGGGGSSTSSTVTTSGSPSVGGAPVGGTSFGGAPAKVGAASSTGTGTGTAAAGPGAAGVGTAGGGAVAGAAAPALAGAALAKGAFDAGHHTGQTIGGDATQAGGGATQPSTTQDAQGAQDGAGARPANSPSAEPGAPSTAAHEQPGILFRDGDQS
ncbi:TrbL/VirB6 plasmid conjugal transfer protein [Promicromonospora umidemergens]|uniref:TrbL/VirB6 plasmid conjugal transfer protein n=1 Tax=Promicromonospora umidemergens TaxID=629679 RepID=A0ABP8XGZ1_9MICO|nr:type IV secretion system protein [Promicromonospora umidemergens]MCP2282823.1 TrbL/VirB6 plasmid conjugal transfer protein [Promicromonospora umidemergens]